MNRNLWVYDIETITNLFTYSAYNIDTEEIVYFVIWEGINQLEDLVKHLNICRGLIGFNNLNFDYPVLHFILNNYDEYIHNDYKADKIVSEIYKKSQEVIEAEYSQVKDNYIKIPQLDLFRIWHYDNLARATSLKKLQIAFRFPNVKDMPFNHYDTIKTYDQVKLIIDYNINDVKSTFDFYKRSLEKIELRKGIFNKYGLTCMNFPDSKIGEYLTLHLYCKETNNDINKISKLRTYRKILKFKECFPNYIHFEKDEFKQLEKYLSSIEVEFIKDSFKYSFTYKDFTFELGTGGIHGCIKAGVYKSDEDHIIVDVDVASLYPSLAITNNLYPEHLGEIFTKVYNEGIIKPRLEAKKSNDKVMNFGFKLAANSVCGKSNSEHSALYDPLYALKTTLAGQLSLCMLSEQLMCNVKDLEMLQINTDGLTARIPISQKRIFYNICKQWEETTKLLLEYASYDTMIIRDVNNYIAKYFNGKIKRKGVFVTYEQMVENEDFHKSLPHPIVAEALEKYFLENIPVEETIMSGDNIYDFCKTFNLKGEFKCEIVKYGLIIPQQKTTRYYLSTDGYAFRKVKDDKIIEIEAKGNKVTIFNDYIKKPIFDYNINYDYYIDKCYKIIHKIENRGETGQYIIDFDVLQNIA